MILAVKSVKCFQEAVRPMELILTIFKKWPGRSMEFNIFKKWSSPWDLNSIADNPV
jgi:hypothetical protein